MTNFPRIRKSSIEQCDTVMEFSYLVVLKAPICSVSMLASGTEIRNTAMENVSIPMAQSIKATIDMISLTVTVTSNGHPLRRDLCMFTKETGGKAK